MLFRSELSNYRRLSESSWAVKSSRVVRTNPCPRQDNVPGQLCRMPLSGRRPSVVVRCLRKPTDHTLAFDCGMSGDDPEAPSAGQVSCLSRTSAVTPDSESVIGVRPLDWSGTAWVGSADTPSVGQCWQLLSAVVDQCGRQSQASVGVIRRSSVRPT